MLKIGFCLLLWLPVQAVATGLVNRYQFLSARSLPTGLWTFAYNRGQSSGNGNSSFSSQGKSVSNTDFFSRDISYSSLLDEVNDPLEKELARAAFSAYEKESTEVAGRAINQVRVDQSSETYVLGRGLNSKSSLFIIFPIVTIKTRFASNFSNGSSLNQFANQLRSEGQYQKAEEILEKSQNALNQRLSENGYRTSYPSEMTTLANIFLDYRYQALEKKQFFLTSDSTLIVPAGKKSDENDFISMRINEEQYSLKQSLTGAYEPHPHWSILASSYYHKRFPFQKSRRIPLNNVSPLSKDIDPETTVQYGDSWGSSLQLNYAASDTWLFYGGRSYETKFKDHFSGKHFQRERYNFLEKGSDQNLSLHYIGVAANTITSFLAKKFPIPVDVNLQYSFPVEGKNTFNNKVIAMNMMVFYK